jgi:hypothetical protein
MPTKRLSHPVPADKACAQCGQTKPRGEFSKDSHNRDGKDVYCRACRHVIQAKWRNRDREHYRKIARESTARHLAAVRTRARNAYRRNPLKTRIHNLRRQYGITVEQLVEMIEAQKGLCASCGEAPHGATAKSQKLHVDHDHTTGRVRALLCCGCNSIIGHAHEDPIKCDLAAAYLRRMIS